MGSELVSSTPPLWGDENGYVSAPHVSYTEIFYSFFPFYLSIGMTFDQYWNADSTLVTYYRKAYELQRKQKNEMLWLQGMYFYEALCKVSPIFRDFAKSGTRAIAYGTQPYPITKEDADRRRLEQQKALRDKFKSKISAYAVNFNGNIAADRGEVPDE